MRTALLVLAFIGVLGGAFPHAQTTTRTLEWDQPAMTPAESLALVYTLKIDTAAATVLTGVSCSVVASVTHCAAPLASFAPGPHTLTLTATNAFGSSTSAPLSGAPPQTPATLKIVITVVVS